MRMLIRFAPFVAFSVVSRAADWRVGVAAGLLTLIAVVVTAKPLRIGVLDAGMFVFFAAGCVAAVAAPDANLGAVLRPACAGWLCLVALVSLAVRHPFTLDVARDRVSAEIAASPRFLAVNTSITTRWAWTFAAIAAVTTVAEIADRPVLGTIATVVLLVAAAKASKAPADRPAPTPTAA